MLVISPAGAQDPVYVAEHKIHTVIGPVKVEEPLKPGENRIHHELRIMMDAGVTHTIRFSDAGEAARTVARILNALEE